MIPLKIASPHPVTHIAFAQDGGAVAVAQPHYGVTLLDRATGHTKGVCAQPKHNDFTDLVFCGESKFLAVASSRGLAVFDAGTGAPAGASGYGHHKYLRLANRGAFLAGEFCGRVSLVWAPNVGFTRQEVCSHPPLVWATTLALSVDGRFTLLADRGRWVALDIDRGRVVSEAPAPPEEARPDVARFCPLGHRFAINDGRTLAVYNLEGLPDEDDGEQPADPPLVQRANGSNQVAVAPLPHTILEPTFTLKPDKPADAGAWHPPFALLPDGRGLLVKRPRNRIQLWDAPTGTLVNEWSWRFEWVTCVAVSGDGLTAVAGGRFGRVLLWDLD